VAGTVIRIYKGHDTRELRLAQAYGREDAHAPKSALGSWALLIATSLVVTGGSLQCRRHALDLRQFAAWCQNRRLR
jgi:hypothetical protein